MRIIALASLVALGACSASQLATVQADNAKVVAVAQVVVKDGQLFCAKATADGPIIVALANAAGAPIVVTGLASSVVAADCALIDAIPVSPPANPTTAPVVAIASK